MYTMESKHEQAVLLVFTKKRWKLFKWRDKIQTWRFVVHRAFNRNKILCIHVKKLQSDFQLKLKMLVHVLNLGTLGSNVKRVQFTRAGRKMRTFRSNKKVCNFFQIAHYFHSKWVYFKSTIALQHV